MIDTESLAQEYFNLANYFYEQNMMEKAIECYEKVIKLKPHLGQAYNNLGFILSSQGDFDRAQKNLKKAIALQLDSASAYWKMAHVFSHQALFDEAKAYWQKAVDLKPDISKTKTTWEYLSNAWQTTDDRNKGYDTQDRIDQLRKNWDSFLAKYKGTKPLGSPGETFSPTAPNYAEKNIFMTYAYILGLASRKKEKLSILDWGGSCGDYYLVSKALFPEVQFDYHIKELPLVCQAGREFLPEVSWYEDENKCFEGNYDLVLVSGSLQYSQNWQSILQKL
ncbi:MAG: tetratricopeptide repeat protein [Okeania sp. SIO3B5]|uniref:protein arginine N-methyltransferase n=1 Tax=Okeania sp. SIO3B5 TaxID=2607811 RepID=UPI0013FE5F57|nr:tetratricopeptide repeat protein [Okeania sp. SIO3B5]NEO52980.1 tetratricopeptide repeat protein [Okeania sp. SIO3B5]